MSKYLKKAFINIGERIMINPIIKKKTNIMRSEDSGNPVASRLRCFPTTSFIWGIILFPILMIYLKKFKNQKALASAILLMQSLQIEVYLERTKKRYCGTKI